MYILLTQVWTTNVDNDQSFQDEERALLQCNTSCSFKRYSLVLILILILLIIFAEFGDYDTLRMLYITLIADEC